MRAAMQAGRGPNVLPECARPDIRTHRFTERQ